MDSVYYFYSTATSFEAIQGRIRSFYLVSIQVEVSALARQVLPFHSQSAAMQMMRMDNELMHQSILFFK